MSTQKKFELLKVHVLSMFSEQQRREVTFSGPDRRQDMVKVSIGNIQGVNFEAIQKGLAGCRVFLRNGKLGGARIDVYIPCKKTPPLLKKTLSVLTCASWVAVAVLVQLTRQRIDASRGE